MAHSKAMDWYSWLSKTGLDSSLVYEYGLAFSHNELEEEDVIYFNHEFLQSVGVSIAKHRLEILKLARKEKGSSPPSVARLLVSFEKAKKCLAQYVRRKWGCNDQESALVVLPRPRPRHEGRWRSAMLLKRNKKMAVGKQERLLLTNGSPAAARWAGMDRFLNPVVCDAREKERMDGGDDGYWSSGVEKEMRWDSLFQDLRPT